MLEFLNLLLCAGGTFALYSLICRHAKISLAHNRMPADLNISSYKLEKPSSRSARASRVKDALEKRKFLQNILLLVVLLGPCLVIGDGSLTPAISGIIVTSTQCSHVCIGTVQPRAQQEEQFHRIVLVSHSSAWRTVLQRCTSFPWLNFRHFVAICSTLRSPRNWCSSAESWTE